MPTKQEKPLNIKYLAATNITDYGTINYLTLYSLIALSSSSLYQ